MAPKANCFASHICHFPNNCQISRPESPNFINTALDKTLPAFAISKIQFDQISFPPLMVNRNIRDRGKTMTLKFHSLFSRAGKKSENPVTNSRFSMDGDSFEDTRDGFTPLTVMADAFEQLSAVVKAKGFDDHLDLKTFCDACSLVSVLFGTLGIAFKFAELEYVSKVSGLVEASASYQTLSNVLDFDTKHDTVRSPGSLSRNLRRVRQGLDLIRALFQNFVSSRDCCLKEAATTAYAKTCAPYHTWVVRTAVYAGMYALPTRDELILRLNETDDSAEGAMRRYINASLPVIEYIDKLYISRDISLDW